ncbi:MAG: endo-1,4-beta-xylanase [Phycisphaeraceae bacterium]
MNPFAYLLELFNKRDPEIEHRIESGIAAHRKGLARLTLRDASGRPATNVHVQVRLNRHEFLFGANIFMLGGYGAEENNRAYEAAFVKVFNSAVAPFYWSDLEPTEGELRFTADSRRIQRRPPPDVVLDFCDRHRLTPKGHCLVWHQWYPDWLPDDPREVMRRIVRRMERIAERYGNRVKYWDVVNESLERYHPHFAPRKINLPRDYTFASYQEAARLFPRDARLLINEATPFSWIHFLAEHSALYMQVQNLLLRGARIDGIGLQYHTFFYNENGLTCDVNDFVKQRDAYLNPRLLLNVMDNLGELGLPLHISEITLPAYADVAGSEQFQADLLRELYRLWFSHPNTEAIYWWNLADGGAHGREGELRGGLMTENLMPKPAYRVLDELIHKEWNTSLETHGGPEISFNGFFGDYRITTKYAGVRKEHDVHLGKNGASDFALTVQ